jgi:serine phosphatase RsbU (regulator of sigma subunit)/Tfp pilus assembly protein PilF
LIDSPLQTGDTTMKYLKVFIFITLISGTLYTRAQQVNTDSLLAVLKTPQPDSSRVKTLNELGYAYYREEPQKTIQLATEALTLAGNANYQTGLSQAYNNIGLGYYVQGDYPQALVNWEAAMRIYELLGDDEGMANILSNTGSIYFTFGDYTRALEEFLKALPLAEKTDDRRRIATLDLNIGSVYSELPASSDTAVSYYHRAIRVGESIGYYDLIGLTLVNLGELYMETGKYDSALHYFDRSLSVISGNIDRAISLNYMASIYAEEGDYEKAMAYHRDALEMAQNQHAQMEVTKVLLGLGTTSEKQGKSNQAIDYFLQARNKASELGLNEELSDAYMGLSTSYASLGDYRSAFKYLSLHNEIDNAELTREAQNKVREVMTYYQLNQKQNEIDLLEQQSQIEQLKARRQRGITIGVGAVGLLILLLAGGLYNRMQFIRRTNEMISAQKDEIESQRNEIEKARDQIQHQHDMVFEQKKLITDSIGYAQRIQSALLPPSTVFEGMTSDHFILFKPKDIVSGDFYWIRQVQDHLVIVSADCTGHGVPGAFMSMLGITLLNDLIGDRCYNAPSAILEELRKKIKEMLVQEGNSDEQKDGMDMALVVLDCKNREIHYAGANNPLYIIRNKSLAGDLAERSHSVHENGEFSLFEVKADKQPIGVHWEETSFQNHSLKLEKEDAIYLFSDGYIDQFGGDNRKKFKSLNFKKLLLSVQTESMSQQRKILEQTFDDWRGEYEQIDDVSVIGIRV